MALLDKFLLLLFSFCFITVYSSEYIPVYMWETSKNYSPLPALGRINEEFFRDILLDKLNKEKVVLVFLEENLSPEDFTTFDSAGESVFYSLSNLKSKAQVNYYPFVETPLKALENLPGVKVSKVDITSTGLPSDVKIEPGQVLIVNLKDAKENEDRSHMLRRHDSLVASIYQSVLSEYEDVIALYTAIHSSWLVPSELDGNGIGRKARHLMQAAEEPEPKYIVVNTNDTLLYTLTPLEFNPDGGDKPILINKITSFNSENENQTVIKGDGVSITLTFESSLGYWFFRKIEVNHESVDYEFNLKDIFAPYGFSYHCNNSLFRASNDTVKYSFSMPGLQVQRFMNTTPKAFDDAFDCVGFTTAPIWSGLFVTFILALIMTFGLCMIMDIKTMDRFDDPKGKTISINVVD